ncbi:MAG: hypothetical protein HPY66_0365 [Firmicutes bacterium]|nr:hypothetical protein [Bacillota bacterium]
MNQVMITGRVAHNKRIVTAIEESSIKSYIFAVIRKSMVPSVQF